MAISASSRQITPLDNAFAALNVADSPEERLKLFKSIRNAVIGNKIRKRALCLNSSYLAVLSSEIADGTLSPALLDVISIISIIAIPDREALSALLSASIHKLLWQRLPSLSSTGIFKENEMMLMLALFKALQALYNSLVELCGPRIWGIGMLSNDAFLPIASASKTISSKMELDNTTTDSLESLFQAAMDEALAPTNIDFLYQALACVSEQNIDQVVSDVQILLAISACLFLSQTIRTSKQQKLINTFENTPQQPYSSFPLFVNALIRLLDYALNSTSLKANKLKEAVCGALIALVRNNGDIASRVQTKLTSQHGLVIDVICNLARDSDPALCLAASCCATTLFKAIAIDPEPLVLHLLRSDQIKPILGVLLRLLHQKNEIATMAAFNLAYLVSNDNELQTAACDMGALSILQVLLKKSLATSQEVYAGKDQTKHAVLLREGVLLAVAALSLLQEKIRKQVVNADLLPLIVQCLSDESSHAVRAAACQCARGLSRSLNVIRTHLVDAGAAGPLLDLLKDEEPIAVQAMAAATCANLLIEYSPMKEALISRNALPRFVQLTRSNNLTIRVHALFALKNLTCWSSSSLKELVVLHLTYDGLVKLLQYADEETQAQALGVLRNLAASRTEDIEAALEGIGESRLLQLLEDKLLSPYDEVVFQAIYIVLNSAASKRCHNLLLTRAGITRALLSHLSHARTDIRTAAVRATKNLAAREPSQRSTNDNALRLRALGFESALRQMKEDPVMDIREHVRLTLELFAQGDFRSDPYAIQTD